MTDDELAQLVEETINNCCVEVLNMFKKNNIKDNKLGILASVVCGFTGHMAVSITGSYAKKRDVKEVLNLFHSLACRWNDLNTPKRANTYTKEVIQ